MTSVKQALVYLGEKEIRRFVSLVAMSRLAEGKPDELIRAACIRGKFCELMGVDAHEQTAPSEMFTLGMFSLIDAVIDQPMDKILGELPLSTVRSNTPWLTPRVASPDTSNWCGLMRPGGGTGWPACPTR